MSGSGQGRENAKTFLSENSAHGAIEIEDKIRAAHGLDFDAPGAVQRDEDDGALLEG